DERSGCVAVWSKGRSSQSRSWLYVGLRQLVRERGACRRAAGRAQFAAKGQVRPLRRAAVRLAVHRAAVHQPALLALPHPTHGQALGALPQDRPGVHAHRPGGAGGERPADRPAALGTDPDTGREAHLRERARTMTTAGDAETRAGMAAHVLLVTASMRNEYFFNADGELLIVAQENKLRFRTEFGVIDIAPGEICAIQRGVIFKVELIDGPARAYGGAFTLPYRGPIGANCLANPRDFLTPVPAYEDKEEPSTQLVKWGGELYATEIGQSPLDVAAWHGNYAPYKYDLRRFSPVGALLFDHPDPSIFTVMTAPSETPGTANVDFVIFPERWQLAENTFRPPSYHRTLMSEFLGLIDGVYAAKPQGFVPGGISLHNCMLPHGPDETAFEHASNSELKPVKLTDTMAFMFETRFPQRLTKYAADLKER